MAWCCKYIKGRVTLCSSHTEDVHLRLSMASCSVDFASVAGICPTEIPILKNFLTEASAINVPLNDDTAMSLSDILSEFTSYGGCYLLTNAEIIPHINSICGNQRGILNSFLKEPNKETLKQLLPIFTQILTTCQNPPSTKSLSTKRPRQAEDELQETARKARTSLSRQSSGNNTNCPTIADVNSSDSESDITDKNEE